MGSSRMRMQRHRGLHRPRRARATDRHIAESRDPVARKFAVQDLAVFELNCLKERSADAHHDGAFLILEVLGVDDGSALEGDDYAFDFHAAAAA